MSVPSQRRIIVKKTYRRRSSDRRRLLRDIVLLLLLLPLLLIRSDAEAKPDRHGVAAVDDDQPLHYSPLPDADYAEHVPAFVWRRDSVGAMPSISPNPTEFPPRVPAPAPTLHELAQTDPVPDPRLPIPQPTAVPEPGTVALLLCSGGAMMLRRRRSLRV